MASNEDILNAINNIDKRLEAHLARCDERHKGIDKIVSGLESEMYDSNNGGVKGAVPSIRKDINVLQRNTRVINGGVIVILLKMVWDWIRMK